MGDLDRVDPELLTLGVAELFDRAAERYGDLVAAAFPGERWTYRMLRDGAAGVARRVEAAAIGPGEHVGLLIPNSGRCLATLLGVLLTGAVPVPLNTRYRTDELPYVIKHADLAALITITDVAVNKNGETVDYLARIAEALPGVDAGIPGEVRCAQAPRLRLLAGYGAPRVPWLLGWPEPGDAIAADPATEASDPWLERRDVPEARGLSDTALLLYTSGTTSRPKGVQVSHGALVRGAITGLVGRLGMTGRDVIWSPAPLCHIGAYMALLAAFAVGAEYVSAAYFDPPAAVDLLTDERVTIAYAGFPAFYFDLAAELRRTGRALPDLAYLTTAASPGEIDRVRTGLPHAHQISLTGSTELCGHICLSDPSDTAVQRSETAGRPLDGIEVSIRDAAGRPLPAGATGELWVRGYCLLTGYYRDEHQVRTTDDDPGWFRTGDLGAVIDGRFAFRGRLKDMVKVGGENVAAAEVEAYLVRHPAVARAQVLGAPDPRLGEVVAAFVELAPGGRLDAAELVAYCRAGMAAYKVPRIVRFVTDWPMSATKIAKPELRKLLLDSDPESGSGRNLDGRTVSR